MKSRSRFGVFCHINHWRPALALMLSATVLLSTGCATTFVPTDAKATCTDLTDEGAAFATWFEGGQVTLNGVVTPADSVKFANDPNCSFYQWSERMYLWLTSPATEKYGGGGGRVFGSKAFFDVSPLDAEGRREFVPHVSGSFPHLIPRFAPAGPNGFQVVTAKDGRMLDLEPTPIASTGRQLIRNARGEAVEIGRITMNEQRKPLFFDTAGQLIEGARPLSRAPQRKDLTAEDFTVQKFDFENSPFFLNLLGNVVEVESGQANGMAVLQAQNGSLVYYTILVNDVFAYFLTGAKNGGIVPQPTEFPTTGDHLAAVVDFAAKSGRTLIDPQALAVEVKMSWVEAEGLTNPNDYITTEASIPVYDMSNPEQWVKTGDRRALLAMVGMHVVGSTAGHPEMIWATFEHQSNMPNGEYRYIDANDNIKTVARDTSGDWLFSTNGAAGPFNQEHMSWSEGNIDANTGGGFTISPSDTIRWKAWGSASTKASSNTEIISINNTVRSLLAGGDVRRNYILTGATWTAGGGKPTEGNQVGTNKLANGTMETYQQGSDASAMTGSNCFTCHTSNPTLDFTSVSSIYNPLKPLF
jgi:hypothetical protein